MKTFKLMAGILGVIGLLFSVFMIYIIIQNYFYFNNAIENINEEGLRSLFGQGYDIEKHINDLEQRSVFPTSLFVFNLICTSFSIGLMYWAKK
jgi:hypothetical protein